MHCSRRLPSSLQAQHHLLASTRVQARSMQRSCQPGRYCWARQQRRNSHLRSCPRIAKKFPLSSSPPPPLCPRHSNTHRHTSSRTSQFLSTQTIKLALSWKLQNSWTWDSRFLWFRRVTRWTRALLQSVFWCLQAESCRLASRVF